MKNRSLIGNKWLFSVLITTLVLFVVGIISNIYPFATVVRYSNLGIRNILFSMEIPWHPRERNQSISLVAIDDRTLLDGDRGGLGRWQEFKREYYAQAIDNLMKHGAIAIGIDVLFSEKADGDDVLAAAIKRAGNVTIGMSIARSSK